MAGQPEQTAAEDADAGIPGEPGGAEAAPATASSAGRRWLRRLLIGLAVVLALVGLWGVVGKYLLPGLLADTIAEQLAALTGRPASVERVEIQPYELLVRIHGLQAGDPAAAPAGDPAAADAATPRSYARIDMVEADLSWRTLRRLAPVVDRLIVVRPDLLIARGADGVYDGADIVERLQAGEGDESTDGETPRFSVANIQLIGGRARLDDRKLDVIHEAARIGLGVPFVSSLPVDQDIEVVPSLELQLDGAPVRAGGHLLPFADERVGEIVLSVEAFDLTRLLPHLPEPVPVRLVSAALDARLTTSFVAPQAAPARIVIRGGAGLAGVEVRQPDDRPLLKLVGVDAHGIEFEPMASRLALDTLRIRAPEITLERRKGEARFLDRVLRALEAPGPDASDAGTTAGSSGQAGSSPAASPPAVSPPTGSPSAGSPSADDRPAFAWSIGTVTVEQGKLDFDDQAFEPKPFALDLGELEATVTGLASPQASPARIELAATGNNGERIATNANATVKPLAVAGEASVQGVPIAHWSWLAGPALQLSVSDGHLSVSTRFEAGQPDDPAAPLGWKLSEGSAEVIGLRALDGDREVVRVATLAASGLEVDPAHRRITVDGVALDGGRLKLARDAKGGLDALGWWDRDRAAGKAAAGKQAPGKRAAAKSRAADSADSATASGGDWRIGVRKARVGNTDVTLEYAQMPGELFAPLSLSALEIETGEWASDSSSPLAVRLSGAVGDQGRLEARGTVVPDTGAADLALVARALPLPAAQPWLPVDINARIRAGDLSADGKLKLSTGPDGALQGGWQGEVAVDGLATRLKRERPAEGAASEARGSGSRGGNRFGGDLLRWETLRLPALKVELSPFSVDVGDVALAGLQSRLVISPQGRFNLQDLFGGESAEASAEGASAVSGSVQTAGAAQTSGTAEKAGAAQTVDAARTGATAARADDGPDMQGGSAAPMPPVSPPAKSGAPPVRVGTVTLTDGNVDFSDFFITPNYSANLTALEGTIGAMSPGQPGDIALKGRLEPSGTVQVAGRIDPVGEPLFLDLRADARDIDLPALSPYSAKYVGYGIEKGKLSASVEYRVVAGQLTAQNQIVLDQLTFGEQVDSPDALQLPVLFAVSLLKDRNGVIDVQLPISGSLDDPQFSITGIVLRLIGNLIVKAVTAPFSLIANLVGSSGEELSSLPFPVGQAVLEDTARQRLGDLAKALTERPGLKLEIGGRVSQADLEAQRRATLDARLKRLKSQGAGARAEGAGARAEGAGARAEGAGAKAGRSGADGGRGGSKVSLSPDERRELIEQAWSAAQSKPVPAAERPTVEAMEAQLLEGIEVREGALRELANRRAQAAKDWLADEGGIEAARLFLTAARLPGEARDGAGGEAAGQAVGGESSTSGAPTGTGGSTAGSAGGEIIGVEMKLGG